VLYQVEVRKIAVWKSPRPTCSTPHRGQDFRFQQCVFGIARRLLLCMQVSSQPPLDLFFFPSLKRDASSSFTISNGVFQPASAVMDHTNFWHICNLFRLLPRFHLTRYASSRSPYCSSAFSHIPLYSRPAYASPFWDLQHTFGSRASTCWVLSYTWTDI